MRAAGQKMVSIDWEGFRAYLEGMGLSRKRVEDYMRYTMKQGYWRLLFEDRRRVLVEVRTLSRAKREKVLAALGWLAEYLGLLDEWEEKRLWVSAMLRRRRLAGGNPRSLALEVLGDPEFVERVVEVAARAARLRPSNYRVFLALLLATGLRPSEAYAAWRAMPRSLVRHFGAVPGLRLFDDRATKRAYATLLTERLYSRLEAAASLGVRPPSYSKLRETLHSVQREDEPLVTVYDFRRAFATALALHGTPKWAIKLLQGHAPRDVFEEHYNKADILHIYEKWYRPALEPLVNRILDA
ncbi:integrase [Pyrodictium abyssi]|uniref:Integrase SSV1 C-terminal domain-containing protein n=1 Tax=Pyrodictium abyssi TaxID=54256 RepID=A0ABM8IZS6_9CREN|nr:hypothetical protein PABY_21200 [Pyrodictium abyssi]